LPLAHEAVEFLLVAGAAEVLHEGLELAPLVVELPPLFLEPAKLAIAVVVEGAVAAPLEAAAARTAAAELAAEVAPGAFEATADLGDAVAPQDVGEHREAERPEHDEAEHHQKDGERAPGGTQGMGIDHHFTPLSG